MLQSLYIKDFILIEKLELDFSEGFSVITGDTGAGKSILLDSILFCLGEKFSGNPVRPGAENCSVSCIFLSNTKINQFLETQDIESDDQLIIKRTQNTQSRKKFFINDQVVSAKILQHIFDLLLEIHGQHNHTLLLNVSSHLQILDEYGGLELLKGQVSTLYKKWQDVESKILEFAKDKSNIEEEIDYLEHICAELEKIDIQFGEEQELADIKKKLQNKDKEIKLLATVIAEIEGSSFSQIVARSQRALSEIEDNKILEQVNANLELAYDKIEDAKSSLGHVIDDYNAGDYSLEEIDDRLYEIRNLARKHNIRVDELPEFLNKSSERLKSLQATISNSSGLEQKAIEYKKEYINYANTLSAKRQEAALSIEKKTMLELSFLEMKKAVFKVELKSEESFSSPSGLDKVRFTASTNPGMALSPIDKVASGGELSRFMLAFRVALFDNAPKNTIIFDEIDVGISGSVADSIGQRLKILSKAIQIIVITHQPQVAGKADQHILVEKLQGDDHTSVNATILESEAKSLELARMISGKTITKAGIDAAKELII
jgi:DNA repair protein RecN (Recombination protein N)